MPSPYSGARDAALAFLFLLSCGPGRTGNVETYTVERGEFVNSVTVTGELDAINSKMVSAPSVPWRVSLKVARIVEDGQQVKADDVLIEFDTSEVEKNIAEAQSELEIAEAEMRKTKADLLSKEELAEIDLQVTELDHRIARLNLEQAAFDAEIDRKEKELKLDEAAIRLKQVVEEMENQKRMNREEISKLALRVKQAEAKLEEAKETLSALTVKAPAPGIAIIQRNWSTRAKYQVDDQPYPGWPMIGLPDLSGMKAKVEINEVDIAKVKIGQETVVRMDAYADTSFAARITEVAPLARNKERNSKVKVFDAVAVLGETSDKLMPGMTIRCEVMVEKIPDTLFVPLEALFRRDGETVVYLRSGGDFEARKVRPGPENDNYVIIASGVKAGDRVALVDPTGGSKAGDGDGGKGDALP